MDKERVNFYLDEPVIKELRTIDVNMSHLVNEMLKSYLESGGLKEAQLLERKQELERELEAVESQLDAIREIKEAEHQRMVPYAEYYQEKMEAEKWDTREQWLEESAEKLDMDPSELEEMLEEMVG